MAKLLQPADGSIWVRTNGDQFEVLAANHARKSCLLRATGTGRKHWVTYEGLAKKYQWVSDAAPEPNELEEDIRADERVRVLLWLIREGESHQDDVLADEHPSHTLREKAVWLADTLRALRDDHGAYVLWDSLFPKGDPIPQEIPEL